MDLITHFPLSNGFDSVFTIVDRFSKYITFVPCSTSSTALDLAYLFYDNIVCKFGMLKLKVTRTAGFYPCFGSHLWAYFNVNWPSLLAITERLPLYILSAERLE